MARRRKRRKKDRDTLGVAPGKPWDAGIQQGSLVFIDGETSPHIYEVTEYHRRVLMAHDMYNSPSLMAKGLKEGDEIPPHLTLRRRYTAPFYEETPRSKVYVKALDGSKVIHVTGEVVASLLSNLHDVLSFIEEETENE